MTKPPANLNGATVICYSPVDERHRHTGACRQIVDGRLLGAMAGLAVCQYDGDDSFYLFGCEADWRVVTDTCHDTVAEAKKQAEFEYAGTNQTWVQLA